MSVGASRAGRRWSGRRTCWFVSRRAIVAFER
jgi:hypothetical protein